jgi:hypothetical protein
MGAPADKSPVSISVVIRTFNRVRMVCDAIESVLRQTYPAYECIVVDDGSTDETSTVLPKRWGRDRIKYMRLQQNAGMAAAQRVGVEASAGDFIAFLDSDDLWNPEHLEVAAAAIRENPGLVLLFTRFGLINENGQPIRESVEEPGLSRSPLTDLLYKRLVVTPSRTIVRRNAIAEIGGVPPFRTGDWVLNVLVTAAYPSGIGQLPGCTVKLRMHSGQDYGRPVVAADLQAATDYIFDRLPVSLAGMKPRVIAINWLHASIFRWQAGAYSSAWSCLAKALRANPSCLVTATFRGALLRLFVPPGVGQIMRRRRLS